jgi:hypothetical protein
MGPGRGSKQRRTVSSNLTECDSDADSRTLHSAVGGSMDFWNAGILPQNYTMSQARRPRCGSPKSRYMKIPLQRSPPTPRVAWIPTLTLGRMLQATLVTICEGHTSVCLEYHNSLREKTYCTIVCPDIDPLLFCVNKLCMLHFQEGDTSFHNTCSPSFVFISSFR